MVSDTATPRNRKARVTAPAPPASANATATANAKATTMCGKNLRWTAVALARKMAQVRERESTIVCDEVAADAAAEARAMHPSCDVHAVERNTRRRVYDALKVMCALGCISRVEKTKTLIWVGPYAAKRKEKKPLSPAAKELADKVAKTRASIGRKRAQARQLCATLSNYDVHMERRRAAGDVDNSARIAFPFVLTAGAAPVHLPEPSDRVRLHFPKQVNIYTETDVVALLAPRPKSRRPRMKRPRVICPESTPVTKVKSGALVTSPATAERHVVPPTPPPALSLHHEDDALNVDTHVLLKPKAELIEDSNYAHGVVPKVEIELMDEDDAPWREDVNEQHALGDLRCLDNADFES